MIPLLQMPQVDIISGISEVMGRMEHSGRMKILICSGIGVTSHILPSATIRSMKIPAQATRQAATRMDL